MHRAMYPCFWLESAYEWNHLEFIYFLRNAMMMIIHSLVKILTHTHTRIHRKMLFDHILSIRNLCYTLLQQYPGDKLNPATRRMYHHTHTYTYNLRYKFYTHIHTQKKSHTNLNVNIRLTIFFSISQYLYSLPDDCRNKAAWNTGSQINTHAIK